MVDLKKINTDFDLTAFLNNFDPAQIPRMIVEQQKPVMLVFLVGSLLIVGGMYNDHRLKEQALRAKMTQEQSKLGVIDSRNTAVKDLEDYKSTLPKEINEVELITKISNFANQYNITISSFKPADMADMGLYDVIDIEFTAIADNFKDTMLFLRKLEESSPIRVNAWTGMEGPDGKITSEIKLSSVHIHP